MGDPTPINAPGTGVPFFPGIVAAIEKAARTMDPAKDPQVLQVDAILGKLPLPDSLKQDVHQTLILKVKAAQDADAMKAQAQHIVDLKAKLEQDRKNLEADQKQIGSVAHGPSWYDFIPAVGAVDYGIGAAQSGDGVLDAKNDLDQLHADAAALTDAFKQEKGYAQALQTDTNALTNKDGSGTLDKLQGEVDHLPDLGPVNDLKQLVKDSKAAASAGNTTATDTLSTCDDGLKLTDSLGQVSITHHGNDLMNKIQDQVKKVQDDGDHLQNADLPAAQSAQDAAGKDIDKLMKDKDAFSSLASLFGG